MKNLLVLVPHLSTGGLPQVTLNKLELLNGEFNIIVVEHTYTSWEHIVQRNKIIKLVGEENFFSLGENKAFELVTIINQFRPHVISIEEFPEMFMDDNITSIIYSENRSWKIVETTHDSSFRPEFKRWLPDKFIFVSVYNVFRYASFSTPAEVIEYPIDKKIQNKKEKQQQFGLDPNYFHFATVGLFTPRKNQAYGFELAERLKEYRVQFHFLGNQAGNFEFYWKPLMEDKPDNCIVWGERNDVPEFLEACDVFFFPSRGDKGNKELNPIAIKEALQYDGLIKVMYNLDVYCNKYNDERDMLFLTGDLEVDAQNVIQLLKLETKKDELIILGTYPNLKERKKLTKEAILALKPLGREIMLVSHYPVDEETQKMVDYYVYDAYNPLTYHTYYTKFYNDADKYYVEIDINGLKDSNQSLTVLTNIINGAKAAKNLGYKSFFYNTYDVILDRRDILEIENSFNLVSKKGVNAYLGTLDTPFGKGIQTNGMIYNTDFFLDTFDDVRTPVKYNTLCQAIKCENFLEDYMVKKLQNKERVRLVNNPEGTLLVNSGVGVSSNSEYYSILPIEGESGRYVFYFFTYNVDSRKIQGSIDDNTFIIDIIKDREYKHEFTYTGNNLITLKFYDGDYCYKEEIFKMNPSTIDKYLNTGTFKRKP